MGLTTLITMRGYLSGKKKDYLNMSYKTKIMIHFQLKQTYATLKSNLIPIAFKT